MTLYLESRLVLGQLLWSGEVCRLRLGRLLALGMVDCSRSIGHTGACLGPDAVQSADCLCCGRVAWLHLSQLLAFGTADCSGQSVVRLPSSAQQQTNRVHPCLERLLSPT